MSYAQELLKRVWLEPERLVMVNMSAADGVLFAEVAQKMASKVKELGPRPVRRSAAKR